jgi:MFS family permease
MQTQQRATLPTLFALLLGFGLMQMGNTLQGTLLSIRGGIEGFSPAQIGAVGAGFWVGIVVGSLRCGKLIQSVGHIRAFVALGAVASTAPLLHLLLIDPIAWVVARALTGFCFAGLFIVVESWLNGVATDETRGQILSVYLGSVSPNTQGCSARNAPGPFRGRALYPLLGPRSRRDTREPTSASLFL